MNRRCLFRMLITLPAALLIFVVAKTREFAARRTILQESPVAGFQYHDGSHVWDRIKINDGLRLEREPDNPHDRRAVAVYWRRSKLGYLPRVENTAVAQLMDRNVPVQAGVCGLNESRNPWERVRVVVSLET